MNQQDLTAIYARLPKINCKRKCQESCGPIVMGQAEYQNMERALGYKPKFPSMGQVIIGAITNNDKFLNCPVLKDGGCSAYQARPLICRLWGLVKAMTCPWGCVPERWVSEEEARGLLAAVKGIS